MGKPNAKPVIKRKRIIEIIKQDANGKDELLGKGQKYCVLGGLLSSAGVPDELLRKRNFPDEVSYRGATGTKILIQKFGLSRSNQDTLMDTNDLYGNTKERRKALIDEVNALA